MIRDQFLLDIGPSVESPRIQVADAIDHCPSVAPVVEHQLVVFVSRILVSERSLSSQLIRRKARTVRSWLEEWLDASDLLTFSDSSLIDEEHGPMATPLNREGAPSDSQSSAIASGRLHIYPLCPGGILA